MVQNNSPELIIKTIKIIELKSAKYNPRKWSEAATEQLIESIQKFGLVDPILVNGAKNRKNIVTGGHFRLKVAKHLGCTEVLVVYVDISEQSKKRAEHTSQQKMGDWDYELLAKFDESLLTDIGFEAELIAQLMSLIAENHDEISVSHDLAQKMLRHADIVEYSLQSINTEAEEIDPLSEYSIIQRPRGACSGH